MKFLETELAGPVIIELEPKTDERGMFARTFCVDEFAAHGLNTTVAQCNLSFNRVSGTLRGLHYQRAPFGETKVVRCTRGAIFDVIVDLRPSSATYLQHIGVELTADNGRALYVPESFAHGFETLEDQTEVAYQMGSAYVPGAEVGIRFDDPTFAIDWPIPVRCLSDRDAALPHWSTVNVPPVGR